MSDLFVVGVGPGDPRLLTPQARAAIERAEVVIAYAGYFALIADLVQTKERVALELGQPGHCSNPSAICTALSAAPFRS